MSKSEIAWKAAVVIWPLIEYWLGKTEKVKSGSTLELVIRGVSKLGNLIFKRKE